MDRDLVATKEVRYSLGEVGLYSSTDCILEMKEQVVVGGALMIWVVNVCLDSLLKCIAFK